MEPASCRDLRIKVELTAPSAPGCLPENGAMKSVLYLNVPETGKYILLMKPRRKRG